MPETKTEILIKEYEVAQIALNAQNETAWQIGSIFIIASLGVLAFVAQEIFRSTIPDTPKTTVLLCTVALISWGTLYLWYRSYRRWGTFVEITHRRMHEIEKVLGMWKNRDVEIVDTVIQGREPDSPISTDADVEHIERVKAWANRLNQRSRLTRQSIDVTIREMVALILFGWLAIIVYQFPANLFAFNKWYLSIGALVLPFLWFYYPRLKSWLTSASNTPRRNQKKLKAER